MKVVPCRHCGSPNRWNPCWYGISVWKGWNSNTGGDPPCLGDMYDEDCEERHTRRRGLTLRVLAYVVAFLALFAVACWFVGLVEAHSWYPAECCSDRDCAPLPDGAVKIVPGGYDVQGEFIPNSEARQGPDENYHICRWPGGKRICFFKPYSGS